MGGQVATRWCTHVAAIGQLHTLLSMLLLLVRFVVALFVLCESPVSCSREVSNVGWN